LQGETDGSSCLNAQAPQPHGSCTTTLFHSLASTITGLGGAGVLDALAPLLQQQLADARGKNQPYHYIVFEAGINDILMKNQKAPQIFERM
jgi:hypothetical protein